MNSDSNLKELQTKSIRGGKIAVASQAATVIIQMASTVILARLLTPEDYGVMAMVMSFTVFAALFKDLGLSSAAIQKKDLSSQHKSNLFWINAGFGLLLTLIVAILAPSVAWFYARPELRDLTLLLSLNFVIAGLSAQHNAMLVRNMQFGRQAIANIVSIAATFAVSVVLAAQGFTYWALAWGSIAGAAVRTTMLWWLSPFVLQGWQMKAGTRALVGFGANVTAFNFVNYFSRNLDNVLIGKFAGADALGIYGRAYQLMMFPIHNLRAPIDAVTFPALCRLQDRPAEWRAFHMQTLRVIAWLTMPLVCWMLLISSPLILILLGEKWAEVVPIFRILALAAFIQPCASMIGSVLLSLGRSKAYMLQGLAMAVVISISFVTGIYWGSKGVAFAYVCANYAAIIPLLAFTYRRTNLKITDFFKSVYLPAVLSLFALSVTFAAGKTTSPQSLAQEIFSTSAIFCLIFFLATISTRGGRRLIRDVKVTLKGSFNQKQA